MTKRHKNNTTKQLIRIAGHVGALIPLVLILWNVYSGSIGVDPIREMTLRTGKAAITLLLLSLAVTPLNIWFGMNQFFTLRRILGVYAFLYVVIHLGIFVGLDYGLNPALIYTAIFEKPYALVGFAAFLILLPLAVTSTRAAMKKMGKLWTRLHRWVYLAGVLAVLHYLLLVKQAYTQPLFYAAVLGILLLTRVKPIRQAIIQRRHAWQKAHVAVKTGG